MDSPVYKESEEDSLNTSLGEGRGFFPLSLSLYRLLSVCFWLAGSQVAGDVANKLSLAKMI